MSKPGTRKPVGRKTVAPESQQKQAVTINLEETLTGALRAIGGSKADNWNDLISNQVVRTAWKTGDEATDSQARDGVLTAMICMKPRDEFEGMLMAQMLGAHNAAMECYKRSMVPGQVFAWYQESLNQANKLSRTYAALLEALNRHRGKGQQKVIVEHVHVYQGGQAIVGAVEAPGAGGFEKREGQPLAVGHAECAPVRREDPKRKALPVAGHG